MFFCSIIIKYCICYKLLLDSNSMSNNYIRTILELNNKCYIENELTVQDYVVELNSYLKSMLLNYNLFTQLESQQLMNKYFQTTLDYNGSRITNARSSARYTEPNIDTIHPRYANTNTITQFSDNDNDDTDNELQDGVYNIRNSRRAYINRYMNTSSEDNTIEVDDTDDNEEDDTIEVDDTDDNTIIDNVIDTVSNNRDETVLYDSINQCCARIGTGYFDLNTLPSEFIDKYPANTYVTDDGHVIGNPCFNLINEFDEHTNYFCNEHKSEYTDIRQLLN